MGTRVFVSSTVADLRDVRAAIIQSLKDMGHEPIHFESNDFYADPSVNTVEACFRQVEAAHLLILVIDRRFGSRYGERKEQSVTWGEYKQARAKRIPVFTLVRQSTMYAWNTYKANGNSNEINYPDVEYNDVLKFLTHVAAQEYGNWVHPFDTYSDAIKWIQGQLSAMLEHLLLKAQSAQQADLNVITVTGSVMVSGNSAEVPIDGNTLSADGVSQSSDHHDRPTDMSRNNEQSLEETGDPAPPTMQPPTADEVRAAISSIVIGDPSQQREGLQTISNYLLTWSVPPSEYVLLLEQLPRPIFVVLSERVRRRAIRRLADRFSNAQGFTYRGRLAQLALRLIDSVPEEKLPLVTGMIVGSVHDNEWATILAVKEEIRKVGPEALRALCSALSSSPRMSADELVEYFRMAAENPNVGVVREQIEAFLAEHDPD